MTVLIGRLVCFMAGLSILYEVAGPWVALGVLLLCAGVRPPLSVLTIGASQAEHDAVARSLGGEG